MFNSEEESNLTMKFAGIPLSLLFSTLGSHPPILEFDMTFKREDLNYGIMLIISTHIRHFDLNSLRPVFLMYDLFYVIITVLPLHLHSRQAATPLREK